jgi:putative hemolysin
MEMSPAVGLPLILALVLANGFFVAAEFGMVAVRRSRLEQLAQEGRRGVRAAQDAVARLDAYVAACQLGITMASLGLGWIGEPTLARLIEQPLALLLGPQAALAAHGITAATAFALITALHIVIGELAPKGLALQRPEGTTLWTAPPLRLFYRIFRWPIGVLNAVGNAVLRLFGLQGSAGHEMVHTAEELRMLVNASQEAGVVEASEARIAARAFRFADTTAGELMTPRSAVMAIEVEEPLEQVMATARRAGHSRLPLYRASLDEVVGVLHVSALLGLPGPPGGSLDLRALAEPAMLIPASRGADHVLEDMRRDGFELAMVVDEYGVTVGLITLHDIMEGLVGRIGDDGGRRAIGRPSPDGSRSLGGLVRLSELEEVTGVPIPEEEKALADTVSGLVMLRLGRIPRVGDVIDFPPWRVQVESVVHQRVGRARLVPGGASAAASPAAGTS